MAVGVALGGVVGAGVKVNVAAGARVELGEGAVLGPGSRIEAHGGTVRIGAGARLGERAIVIAHSGIEIGEGAVIGAWATVADAGPTFVDSELPVRRQPLRSAPIRIGARARVGIHAVVGASLPDGAEVAPYEVIEREDRESFDLVPE